VTLCHLTENLFDKLRNGELHHAEAMDVILAATATVRGCSMPSSRGQPSRRPAEADLIASLKQAIAGELPGPVPPAPQPASRPRRRRRHRWRGGLECLLRSRHRQGAGGAGRGRPRRKAFPSRRSRRGDHQGRHRPPGQRQAGYSGPVGRRDSEKARDNSIRVDTARLDQVLNLSGEIGLTKNRLNSAAHGNPQRPTGTETLQALDAGVGQLDLLVSDLQNAVMKTRMQPIGRLFQKYPRIARDLARNLGKDVELVLPAKKPRSTRR
jgi:two-component system chemotaxis sensor kinase CheA